MDGHRICRRTGPRLLIRPVRSGEGGVTSPFPSHLDEQSVRLERLYARESPKRTQRQSGTIAMAAIEYRLNKVPFLLAVCCTLASFLIGSSIPIDTESASVPDNPSDSSALPFHGFLDGYDEWEYIIGANLRVCVNLLAGLLSLGYMSMVNLAWIGLSLGWAVQSAMGSGMSHYRLAALTLPHGLMELGAFALIAAVGCEGFVFLYRKLRFDVWSFGPERLSLNLRRLIAGLFLLLAASIVETYITGQIAARFN